MDCRRWSLHRHAGDFSWRVRPSGRSNVTYQAACYFSIVCISNIAAAGDGGIPAHGKNTSEHFAGRRSAFLRRSSSKDRRIHNRFAAAAHSSAIPSKNGVFSVFETTREKESSTTEVKLVE
jgi:hypothetical protein